MGGWWGVRRDSLVSLLISCCFPLQGLPGPQGAIGPPGEKVGGPAGCMQRVHGSWALQAWGFAGLH